MIPLNPTNIFQNQHDTQTHFDRLKQILKKLGLASHFPMFFLCAKGHIFCRQTCGDSAAETVWKPKASNCCCCGYATCQPDGRQRNASPGMYAKWEKIPHIMLEKSGILWRYCQTPSGWTYASIAIHFWLNSCFNCCLFFFELMLQFLFTFAWTHASLYQLYPYRILTMA